MRRLVLEREIATPRATQGILRLGNLGTTLYTLERPWVPEAPGGAPSVSCVPAGVYKLIPHKRPNGDNVVALVNRGLGVYYLPNLRPSGVGRYLVLIHPANWVDQIEGCIAPGYGRMSSSRGPMVTESKKAMKLVMDYIGHDIIELEIQGTNDV
jgi:hypothetical protein